MSNGKGVPGYLIDRPPVILSMYRIGRSSYKPWTASEPNSRRTQRLFEESWHDQSDVERAVVIVPRTLRAGHENGCRRSIPHDHGNTSPYYIPVYQRRAVLQYVHLRPKNLDGHVTRDLSSKQAPRKDYSMHPDATPYLGHAIQRIYILRA